MLLPLKLVGLLAGFELLVLALILSYRERYFDGVRYPARIPFTFFLAGAVVILTLSEVTLAAILQSFTVTLLVYYALMLAGAVAFLYFWFVWEPGGCVVDSVRRLRDRLR
jgi:hypothetical protein